MSPVLTGFNTPLGLPYRAWEQAETIWPEFRGFPSLPLTARSVVDDALMYAEMGLHVLPGVPGLKMPFYGSKWADASCDPDEVCRLFERHPEAEVLVLCGPSKIAVVDVDPRNYGVTPAGLPEGCWIMDTPKGGNQFVFTDPESLVPTTAARISEGVDTRGVGGLIVVPSVNSPKRKWASRPGSRPSVMWPYERFTKLGSPQVKVTPQVDPETGEIWTPVDTVGERISPNEHCPGPEHKNGDLSPSLGRFRMPDGTTRHSCFSGCPDEVVQELLIAEGRYTGDQLYGYALPAEEPLPPFMSRGGLRQIKPPEWQVEPYIAEGALVGLCAKFNTGKTFAAVEWAMRMAAADKRVLYVVLEGMIGMQSRVDAWEAFHGTSIENIVFNYPERGLNLLNERSVEELCQEIDRAGGFDLVVIDNFGEAMPGDENGEDMARALNALKRIQRAAGLRSAVMDLHNSGHGEKTRARGHSKYLDAHDTVIYLDEHKEMLNGIRITCGKERNAERFAPRFAQLIAKAGSLVFVEKEAPNKAILEAIRLGHTTIKAITSYLGANQKTIETRMAKMLESNDVRKDGKEGHADKYAVAWSTPLKGNS